ncbi:O-methyltransferase [Streptomyces sp. NRRL F-5126]|uniref:O-methyltransferase n=1 Tax=Streptomyces sp. NRRL F-5126 TaxID=1463857 RepID=UPI0004CC23AA|nr:O-methyltransferase [Streptomyces sp. NRRL F-5126]
MAQQQWTAVDDYFTEHLVGEDEALRAALDASAKAGMPPINVAPNQGKLLQLIAQLHGARRILEIGTLGGYSTIWLARALPEGGRLVTLEADPLHADVARGNLAHAGLADRTEVRPGPALDTLAALHEEGAEPFDLVFIDADKPNNPRYLEWVLKLTRRGSVIIGDNVARGGAVADADSADPSVRGIRAFVELAGDDPRLSATAVQTVGTKGHDGFLLARVIA